MNIKASIYSIPRLLSAAAVLMALDACTPSGPELRQDFMESGQVVFSVKGKRIHVFDPVTWQASYSPDPCTFSVCNDNMSDYYILRCDRTPEREGESVKCSLEWTTYKDIKKKSGVDFSVVRTDPESGVLWLWSSDELIGAAVMTVE